MYSGVRECDCFSCFKLAIRHIKFFPSKTLEYYFELFLCFIVLLFNNITWDLKKTLEYKIKISICFWKTTFRKGRSFRTIGEIKHLLLFKPPFTISTPNSGVRSVRYRFFGEFRNHRYALFSDCSHFEWSHFCTNHVHCIVCIHT